MLTHFLSLAGSDAKLKLTHLERLADDALWPKYDVKVTWTLK